MLSRAHRFVVSLAVLCLLFAAHVPLLAFAPLSAASCCRNGHSCCHKSHGAGARVQPAGCGAAGCCVAPGTQSAPFEALRAPAFNHGPAAAISVAPVTGQRFSSSVQLPLDRFQRPPPALA